MSTQVCIGLLIVATGLMTAANGCFRLAVDGLIWTPYARWGFVMSGAIVLLGLLVLAFGSRRSRASAARRLDRLYDRLYPDLARRPSDK